MNSRIFLLLYHAVFLFAVKKSIDDSPPQAFLHLDLNMKKLEVTDPVVATEISGDPKRTVLSLEAICHKILFELFGIVAKNALK